MTGPSKATEIALLDKLINRLGPDSYLGEWLTIHRAMIVWCIHNDLPISVGVRDPTFWERYAAKAIAAYERDDHGTE